MSEKPASLFTRVDNVALELGSNEFISSGSIQDFRSKVIERVSKELNKLPKGERLEDI